MRTEERATIAGADDMVGCVWVATKTHNDWPMLKLEVDHGVLDERGRLVGGFGIVYQVGEGGWWAPGHVGEWIFYTQATRDGVSYGASQRGHLRMTQSQAREAAESQLAAQRKSYRRKYQERV